MADEFTDIINKHSRPISSNISEEKGFDDLINKYSRPTPKDLLGDNILTRAATPTGQPSEEGINALMELFNPGVSALAEGVGTTGGAGVGSALGTAIGNLPLIRSLPGVPSALRYGGGAVGGYLGNILGGEGGEAIKSFEEGAAPYEPGKAAQSKTFTERSFDTAAALASDKLFNSVFGQNLRKSAKELENEAGVEFAGMLGVKAGTKAAKSTTLDPLTKEAVPDIATDMVAAAKDGLFKKVGKDIQKVQTEVANKLSDLGSSITPALQKAGAEIENPEQAVLDSINPRLQGVREWVDNAYKSRKEREVAYSLLDEIEGDLSALKSSKDLTLDSTNTLKQNYYSDKAKYGTGGASEDKVANTVNQKIANALKETVEELYDATPYGKKNKAIKEVNELYGNYKAIEKAIETPAAEARFPKPMSMGGMMNAATGAGALSYMLANPSKTSMAVGLGLGARELGKTSPARFAKGTLGMLGAETLEGAANLASRYPSIGTAGSVLGAAAKPLMAGAAGEGLREVPLVNETIDAAKGIFDPKQAKAEEFVPIQILPRDTKKLFEIPTEQFPPELLANQDFQNLLTEGQNSSDVVRAQMVSDFIANNPDIAKTQFEQSPIRGFNVIKADDGKHYIQDEYERAGYADLLKRTEKDPIALTKKLNALNKSNEVIITDTRKADKTASVETSPKAKTIEVESSQGNTKRQDPGY